MLTYREMNIEEAIKIGEIDASYFIEKVWKKNEGGEYCLQKIDWVNEMLPYGMPWHYDRFRNTIINGGKAFGCFDGRQLVGFATVDAKIFGRNEKYVLLDQLFISANRRNLGIGNELMKLCMDAAIEFGAEKLYLCAWSSEATIAFYKKLGCTESAEVNEELYEEDRNNIQLELKL